MTKYLYAAFLATWGIHIIYLASLALRSNALRKEWEDLRRSSQPDRRKRHG